MKKSDDAPSDQDELLALVRRAEAGDAAAMPALRAVLKDPAALDMLGGDLARQAQLAVIGKFSGTNLLFKEVLTRKAAALRAELLGENGSPLERLLVDRVVACWLQVHCLETAQANRESETPEMGLYYQRCLSAGQKRFLAAIKTLAQVRRLAVPVLQVNIARKQVNVAGLGL